MKVSNVAQRLAEHLRTFTGEAEHLAELDRIHHAIYQKPHVVYECRDHNDEVIYVGMTLNVQSRMAAHRSTDSFWRETSTITLHHVWSRPEADDLETMLIQRYQPRWNTMKKQPGYSSREPFWWIWPAPTPPIMRVASESGGPEQMSAF